MNNEYLSGSLAWSFVGAIFGYSVCYVQIKLTDKMRGTGMTKPEDIKKGDHRGGYREWWRRRKMYVFFAAVGIGMVLQQLSFQAEQDDNDRADAAARACLIDQFSALTDALEARGGLGDKTAEANQKVISTISTAFADNDLAAIAEALNQYKIDQEAISDERKMNPFPPFPNGKCDP